MKSSKDIKVATILVLVSLTVLFFSLRDQYASSASLYKLIP